VRRRIGKRRQTSPGQVWRRVLPNRYHDAARIDARLYDRLIPHPRRP
jgi:hypothetical protein